MSKRRLTIALDRILSPRISLSKVSIRPTSTSTPDNLDGLIEPSPDFPSKSRVSEEFQFLREPFTLEEKNGPGTSSNDVMTICGLIRDSDDRFGNKTQKKLREFRIVLNEGLVVEVLNFLNNAELGVKFFLWAGRQIGYTHSLHVFEALLDVLGCNKNEQVPDNFLKEIRDDDENVLRTLLNVLVQKCCRNGFWNLALEELGRLKDFGYKPSKDTYNALVQVFLLSNKLDTAYLLHREMRDAGMPLDFHTLGCFVKSMCKVGKWREALDLINKEDVTPGTLIYTQMISGLCEASLFQEAMDMLNIMRSNSCVPNVVTFRTLLTGCLNKGKLGRCKVILKTMMIEGCYPSHRIFNSLIHSYCKDKDYAYAYKLLDKMVKCGYQPGYVVYNILIGGICGNNELPSGANLGLAEIAYCEMLKAGVVLNKVNVCNFARCLCNGGKFEKAYNVICEMMTKGFIPDCSTYSKVIEFMCNASKMEEAFALFGEMKRNGIGPDVYAYTILIDNFCKAGLIQQAQIWFDDMIRDGCTPNVVTYTALIHAYLKNRKLLDANELFEMMISQGCEPNIVTYGALLDGHCKAGDIEKACRIYERMKGSGDISDIDVYFRTSNNSEKPNVVTYGALIDGLCKAHKVKEANNLLSAMVDEGCEPNHIVYDALIDGFCKDGKLDQAREVFSKMSQRGYRPNVYTYSSLIDGLFKDKRLDLASQILTEMLDNSCAPNVIVYTTMIDGLCKNGKTDEAYRLMLMMEEKGCRPNVVTYTAMIDGFGKSGKIDKSLQLLNEMKNNGCAPNFVTYRVLINHCCGAGLLDKAYELLEEMKLTYWPKHIASYRKVIEGFSRDFIVSIGLVDEMSESNSVPIAPAYRVLIESFCKANRLDDALELYKEFSFSKSLLLPIDMNMYYSLISSLSLLGNVEKAFEVYGDMIKKGGVTELSVIYNLIKGLVKINRWEEALLLSHSLCNMDISWVPNEDVY